MVKKVLLWISALAGACVAAMAGLFLLISIMQQGFTPAKTGIVADRIYAVSDEMVSMFVLKAGDDLIAFDAGNNREHIKAGFEKLGLDPLKVKAVFLTHSDGDHVCALPLFPNATVYLPEKEEPLVTGKAKRHFLFFSRINALPVSAYTLIADGKDFSFGGATVKACLTPGHTPGSTSYLINGKYLVTGDLALIRNGKLASMPGFITEDPKLLKDSLSKVGEMNGVEMILTAHTGFLKK